jgi:hypothetical protein
LYMGALRSAYESGAFDGRIVLRSNVV